MTGDLYGPNVYFRTYYDRDSPQYFMDFSSSSNINTLTSQGMTVNNDTAPRIIYRKGGADRFDAGVGTDNRFYISDMSNRVIQMDSGSGNTSIRGSITTDNSLYGNIYYDRYNPGYYSQPRGTSRLNHIESNTHSNNDWLSSSNIYADQVNTDSITTDTLYVDETGNADDIYIRRAGKWASELGTDFNHRNCRWMGWAMEGDQYCPDGTYQAGTSAWIGDEKHWLNIFCCWPCCK